MAPHGITINNICPGGVLTKRFQNLLNERAKKLGIKYFALSFTNKVIDIINFRELVGDSAAMVMLGYENTLPITMDEMLVFVKAVSRGTKNALVVADMPFMSYQTSARQALENAGRFIKEGNANAIKLEGGKRVIPQITAIVRAGIPVMGHLG